MTDALLAVSVLAIPCLITAAIEQHKVEKERREREQALLREQLTVLACERAVEQSRQAWINKAKQSLANWEPIKFTEDSPIRKPRKWGRHA